VHPPSTMTTQAHRFPRHTIFYLVFLRDDPPPFKKASTEFFHKNPEENLRIILNTERSIFVLPWASKENDYQLYSSALGNYPASLVEEYELNEHPNLRELVRVFKVKPMDKSMEH
jgi:hypothetical protein